MEFEPTDCQCNNCDTLCFGGHLGKIMAANLTVVTITIIRNS